MRLGQSHTVVSWNFDRSIDSLFDTYYCMLISQYPNSSHHRSSPASSLAEHYPKCKITGISNSHSQREYIHKTATERGLNLDNIKIVTVRLLLVVVKNWLCFCDCMHSV